MADTDRPNLGRKDVAGAADTRPATSSSEGVEIRITLEGSNGVSGPPRRLGRRGRCRDDYDTERHDRQEEARALCGRARSQGAGSACEGAGVCP